MKSLVNNVRSLGLMSFALVGLAGCPAKENAVVKCEVAQDCASGFLCVEQTCVESLTCDQRVRGATTITRKSNTVKKGEECKGSGDCADGLYCNKLTEVCADLATSGGACTQTAQCPVGEYCQSGTCAKAGCDTNQFCREGAASAECVTAGCRTSEECSNNLKCIESECKPAPTDTPDSCVITNQARSFADGATVAVTAVAYKGNEIIPFLDYTVSSSNEALFRVVPGTKNVQAVALADAGSATISVTFGSFQCPDSAVFFHAGTVPAAEYSRVVAYEIGDTGEPVPVTNLVATNFKFAGSNGVSSDAEGGAAFVQRPGGIYLVRPSTPGSYESLNIVVGDYNPTTIVFGADGKADVSLPLEKLGQTSGFGGKPSFTEFDKEFPSLATSGTAAVTYSGGSLPLSSLLNFSLDLFTGDLAPTAISASSLTSSNSSCTVVPNAKMQGMGEINLPRALYAQVGAAKLGVNCDGVAVRAIPGRRKPWSLGAKVSISDITQLIPAFTNASGSNIASIIAAILPLFDNFAIGNDTLSNPVLPRKPVETWNAFREKSSADMASSTEFPTVTVSPSRRLKFLSNFDNPGLPMDIFPDATDKMNAVITLVAALSPAYGIVPLGFGAGIDSTGDGKLESLLPEDTVRFPADKVHVRHASPAAELSEADLTAVSVSLNVNDLTADVRKNPAIRIRGLVTRDKARGIGWSVAQPALGDFNAAVRAVNFAADAKYTYDASSHTITLPTLGQTSAGADPSVVVLRINRTGSRRVWNVIVNPARVVGAPITLSTVNLDVGQDDVVCDTCTAKNISFSASALEIANAGASFSTAFGPKGGRDLEALSSDTKSFTVYTQEIERGN
jgi:Dickkopf N-terminal cysteine-rich region